MTAVSLLTTAAVALALPASASAWGGAYPTGDRYGTSVDIQVSDTYPVDQTLPQSWAGFLGSLVHGPELATLHLVLQPAVAIEKICGAGALACYNPATSTMEATPDAQSDDGPTAREIVIHEYGHHISNNRSNAPWKAENTGTKRWASYENVCLKTKEGKFDPGGEDQADYSLNPGEGFAEAYRVLNLKLEGVSPIDWGGVDDAFFPNATALKLLEEDVTDPWTGPTVTHVHGTFPRAISEQTTLDGTFTAYLHAPANAHLELFAGAKRVARGGHSLKFTICGQRRLTLKVEAPRGHGSFTVDVSKP